MTVEHAALDPVRGYANAIRDELPDAVAVLDAFHVVKSGSTALDEVHRRVQQQDICTARGHRDDPLYRIRHRLMTGVEHLTDRAGAAPRQAPSSRRPQRRGPPRLAWPTNAPGRSTSDGPRPVAGSPSSSSTSCTPARSPRCPAREDAAAVASPDPGLLRDRRGQQRRHRGHQWRHREDSATRPRLPQLQERQATDPARRRRNPALPRTTCPCLISEEWVSWRHRP